MALVHAAPGKKIHLAELGSISADGKTSALVKTDRFEAVHLVLRSGTNIAPHAVDGYVMLLCLEGAVLLDSSTSVKLCSGDWIYLDRGEEHSLSATEDSSLLLTIVFERH